MRERTRDRGGAARPRLDVAAAISTPVTSVRAPASSATKESGRTPSTCNPTSQSCDRIRTARTTSSRSGRPGSPSSARASGLSAGRFVTGSFPDYGDAGSYRNIRRHGVSAYLERRLATLPPRTEHERSTSCGAAGASRSTIYYGLGHAHSARQRRRGQPRSEGARWQCSGGTRCGGKRPIGRESPSSLTFRRIQSSETSSVSTSPRDTNETAGRVLGQLRSGGDQDGRPLGQEVRHEQGQLLSAVPR